MKEKISAYIDSELATEEVDTVIDGLRNEPNARDDWVLYHLAGDAMRGYSTMDDGFSKGIIEKLKTLEIDPSYDPLDDSKV